MTLTASWRVAMAPAPLVVRARYNVEAARGTICIVVDGAEFHTSCWTADGLGAPMEVREFRLEAPGLYDIWVQSSNEKSVTISVELR